MGNLGVVLRAARRFDEAITSHHEAAQIFRDTGDRHGEGKALGNIGIALQEVQRFTEAVAACQAAAQIFRDTDDQRSVGIALDHLGRALRGAAGTGGGLSEDS